MPALGLSQIVSTLILWGIPLAIILSHGSLVIRAVRTSDARHVRIVSHLGRIQHELSRVRQDFRNPLPSVAL
ncbi:MAG: hypothetical protein M3O70_25925 [Actinomycetota bacterium]|nr:hypothetical protein [Actinomycetota bacterium]